MKRRTFISLLAGTAGAALVPWRGTVEPLIILPARPELVQLSGLELMELTYRKHIPAIVRNVTKGNLLLEYLQKGKNFPLRINQDAVLVYADRLAALRGS